MWPAWMFLPRCRRRFQKGEGQILTPLVNNILISSRQAIWTISKPGSPKYQVTGLKRVIIIYDVMCQYYKRLNIRVEESQYLMLPLGMAILLGIGLFMLVAMCGNVSSSAFLSKL